MSDWNEPTWWDRYDRSHYQDPTYGDLQYDEWWQLNGPMGDGDVMSRVTRAAGLGPQMDEFSIDSLSQANPAIRSYAVEALADRDPIEALAYLQSQEMRDRMYDEVGRTEWDEYGRTVGGADFAGLDGAGKDKAVVDSYLAELENLIYGGAPSQSRNQAKIDELTQYYGGRPPAGGAVGGGAGGYAQGGAQGAPAYEAKDVFTEGLNAIGPEDRGEAQGPDRWIDDNNAVVGGRLLNLDAVRRDSSDYADMIRQQQKSDFEYRQASNPRNALVRQRAEGLRMMPQLFRDAYARSKGRNTRSTTRSSRGRHSNVGNGRSPLWDNSGVRDRNRNSEWVDPNMPWMGFKPRKAH